MIMGKVGPLHLYSVSFTDGWRGSSYRSWRHRQRGRGRKQLPGWHGIGSGNPDLLDTPDITVHLEELKSTLAAIREIENASSSTQFEGTTFVISGTRSRRHSLFVGHVSYPHQRSTRNIPQTCRGLSQVPHRGEMEAPFLRSDQTSR